MSLAPEQLRALDTLRNRLSQLYEQLSRIMRDLMARDPLPTWPQIESMQSSLAFTLQQLNETMTLHAQTLKEAHIYPTSEFPGHREADIMFTLLRKKLEVQSEGWIKEYTADYDIEGAGIAKEGWEELWGWAGGCSQGVVRPMLEEGEFEEDFTLAEKEEGVENVRTGLKRKLWEDESGVEEEGEKMEEDSERVEEGVEEGVDLQAAPLPLESMLRFVTTGAMPTRPNR